LKKSIWGIFIIFCLILCSFYFGFLTHKLQTFPYGLIKYFTPDKMDKNTTGDYTESHDNPVSGDHSPVVSEEKLTQLTILGYLQGYQKAPDKKNVTIFDRNLTFNGLNFYCSGHGPEAILIDMYGKEIHRWGITFENAFPDYGPLLFNEHDRTYLLYHAASIHEGKKFWRRVYMYPDGDVLANFYDFGLIKINKDSEIIWAKKDRFHHDIFVGDDGTIYTLTRRSTIRKNLNDNKPVLEDFIVILNSAGEKIREISILDCILNSHFRSLLTHVRIDSDILHTNTIEVFDGRHSKKFTVLKKDNILVSMLSINAIGIIDPEIEKIVWSCTGFFRQQHDPQLLKNGNILLFDNMGYHTKSKVIEFDPVTFAMQLIFPVTPNDQLFSQSNGSIQRLPNGNTLIVESNNGRALEVTDKGKIVWEFYNPNRPETDNQLMAVLYDLIRVPSSTVFQEN